MQADRLINDVGGQRVAPLVGPVDRSDHARDPWEFRCDAVMVLLRRPQTAHLSLDEVRRNIEALGDDYLRRRYTARMLLSSVQTLLQRGVISSDELATRLADDEAAAVALPMHHDMGGQELPAAVARCKFDEPTHAAWELRVDALMMLLSHRDRRMLRVDELRRNIEGLGPQAYQTLGYYERWMHAIAQTLVQRGIVTLGELQQRMPNVEEAAMNTESNTPSNTPSNTAAKSASQVRPENTSGRSATVTLVPLFKPGDRVRVKAAYPPGHIRTPFYCRGRVGVIERLCGAFGNPEELAYHRSGGPTVPLYRVRFAARELWPDYAENPSDVIEIEIFQHWLMPGDGLRG